MSKIAILTQPLGTNYGGMLQAFALQHVLREMGHEPITIDRRSKVGTIFELGSLAKGGLLWAIGRQKRIRRRPTARESEIIFGNTKRFVSEYIATSPTIYTSKELSRYTNAENFDAYVVGSDQVWRKSYSPCMDDFFLGFVPKESRAKRIAYAASFGIDQWEFNDKETDRYSEFAKRFDLITVREDNGIRLCRDHLGVKASQVVDPTMLVNRSVYEQLALGPHTKPSKGDLFCYILDRTPNKMRLVKQIAQERGLRAFELLPKTYSELITSGGPIQNCILPSTEQWLRSFLDSEFVVTDSFHGTVFSIIFEKQCIVLENQQRGADRFTSLFKILGIPSDGKTGIKHVISKPKTFQPLVENSYNKIKSAL